MPEEVELVGGEVITAHAHDECNGDPCCVHSPSQHHMSEWPQHWRCDRYLMERICPHGVGHPDPDDASTDRIHGCDGCCSGPRPDHQHTCTSCKSSYACAGDDVDNPDLGCSGVDGDGRCPSCAERAYDQWPHERNYYAVLDLRYDGFGVYGPFDREDAEKIVQNWTIGAGGIVRFVSGDVPACYPFGMEDDGVDPEKYGEEK